MHPLPQALLLLAQTPGDDLENSFEQLEKTIGNIDLNSVPQDDFYDLFSELESLALTGLPEQKKSTLQVMGYVMELEILVERFFSNICELILRLYAGSADLVLQELQDVTSHINTILESYQKKSHEPEKQPEFFAAIYQDIEEAAIALYLGLQEAEKSLEQSEQIEDIDMTTPFGPPRPSDTKSPHLASIRYSMETLHEGVLGTIMYDKEYTYQTHPDDPDLEIIARYKQPCKTQAC